MGKVIPKRKQWSAVQPRGPKRVKVEVKSTQTEESECLKDGMTTEAYELMVRGKILYPCSTNCRVYPQIVEFFNYVLHKCCRNASLHILEGSG